MADSTRKVCLIFLTSESFDCLTVFEQAFIELDFEVEAIRIPNFWIGQIYQKNLNCLKALINKKKSEGYFVVFCPQSTELFLAEPDLTIIYSAYRSWFKKEKIRVIPHLWTPIKTPKSIDHSRWTSKPPLRIGFMGRDYMNSRLANIAVKAPMRLRKWFLRAPFLKEARLIARLNEMAIPIGIINTFTRIELIRTLLANQSKFSEVQLDVVERQRFDGSERELNEYVDHLERNTYILCPRGAENYSFRIYETLSHGRIPVIIDTDVVLPKEIDWDQLSVRVPYDSLELIYDIILSDYNSRSSSEFILRQNRAFTTMAELQTMRWVKKLANELSIVIART